MAKSRAKLLVVFRKNLKASLLPTVVAALALIVIVGWLLRIPGVVQIHPNFAPMQFNTALAFLLLAIATPVWIPRSVSIISASACLLLAGLTMAQYSLSTSFGVDTLFVEPFLTTKTSHPGRMSPITAVAFILSSCSLLLLLRKFTAQGTNSAALVPAIGSLILSFGGLVSYSLQLELFLTWGDLTRMAIHTAFGHLLLSIAIVYRCSSTRLSLFRPTPLTFAITAFCIGFGVTIVLWQAALADRSREQSAQLQKDAALRITVIKELFNQHLSTLRAVERLYAASATVTEEEFIAFVKPFLSSDPSLMAIDWTPRVEDQERGKFEQRLKSKLGIRSLNNDRQLHSHPGAKLYFPVLYSASSREVVAPDGFDHYSDKLRTIAMDQAARSGAGHSTQPFALFRAEKEKLPSDILVVVPVYEKLRSPLEVQPESATEPVVRGFIVGVFRLSTLAREALKDFAPIGINFEFAYQGRNAASSDYFQYLSRLEDKVDEVIPLPRDTSIDITLAGENWRVFFAPTAAYLSNSASRFPELILFFSLLLSSLSSVVVYIIGSKEERSRLEAEESLRILDERNKLQERFVHQSARLQYTVDGASLGTWDWDLPSSKIKYNERFCEMIGYSVEDLDQHIQDWKRLIHPEDKKRVSQGLQRHLRSETASFQTEMRIRTADGDYKWIFSSGKVIERDEAGRAVRAVGIHLDIDSQKQAEEKLTRTRAQLEAFIRHAPAAVAMFDREVRYVAYSDRWLQDYGLEGQNLIGRSHYEVFPDIPEVWKEKHQNCLSGAVEKNDCEEFVRDSGDSIFLKWDVRPWREANGEIGGIAMYTENITNKVRMMQELEQSRVAAEEASKAKAVFLANMSHEIRTPLTAIIGFSEILTSNQSFELGEAGTAITRNAQHLLDLVNDILDFSKIEAGKLEVVKEPCNLFEMCSFIKSSLHTNAKKKGLAFDFVFEYPLPEVFIADGLRVKQVLINLISNAIKFTKSGGVTVSVRFDKQTRKLTFDVIDTGIGLTETQISRLFDSFSQGEASTTKRYGGTGLGLAISQQLAQMLDGDITVKSTPERGSVFSFLLYNVEADPNSFSTTSPTNKSPVRKAERPSNFDAKVLVVDDGRDNRLLLEHLLSRAGCQIETVENGLQAVHAAANESFDLIIMDMQMPQMDGYTATQEIRASGSSVPILACTADASRDNLERCQEAGCNEVLFKPFRRESLYSALETCLESRLLESSSSDDSLEQVQKYFIKSLEKRLHALILAFGSEDTSEVAKLAHTLAGATLFGFADLGEAAAKLERLARAKDVEEEILAKAQENVVALARLLLDDESGELSAAALARMAEEMC